MVKKAKTKAKRAYKYDCERDVRVARYAQSHCRTLTCFVSERSINFHPSADVLKPNVIYFSAVRLHLFSHNAH